jgi:hypothetical protein
MANSELFRALPGRLQTMGDQMGGPMGGAVNRIGTGLGGALGKMFDAKGKGAPQDPAPMKVPQATGGFYQPANQQARSQLLQSMMQRSRAGRQVGA